jgi:hypothetical protein
MLSAFGRILFVSLLSIGTHSWAAVTIQNLAVNSSSIERLDKFELSFDLAGASFSNAFDPAQVDVQATFNGPGGVTQVVNGFYMRDYTRTGCPTESLTAGAWKWKVRYAPRTVGAWTVSLAVSGSGVPGGASAGPTAFTCISSARKGFIKVSPADGRYFAYEDGSQFIPIGQNVAWNSLPGGYSCDFSTWLPKIAAQGGNFQRYWFAEFADGFEWSDTGLGDYSNRIANTWRTDYTVELARSLDIQMMIVFTNMGELRQSGFENKWPQSPYNSVNGGPCANPQAFFTNATAKAYHKRKLRYIIARWGYASNVTWETFNELDFVDSYNSANIAAWHQEMVGYVKALDLNRHMVSVSFSDEADEDAAIWSLPEIDFTGFHRYSPSNQMEDEHLATTQHHHAAFGKPVLGGEVGIVGGSTLSNDPYAVHMHNSNWAGVMSTAAGTPLFWDWNNYVDPGNFYSQYRGVANFTAGLDYLGSGFSFTQPTLSTPSYSSYVLTPGYTTWGTPPAVSAYTVSPMGTLSPGADQLSEYQHTAGSGTRYNPRTFSVNYAQAGTFAFYINGVSGSNTLQVKIDGVTALTQAVSLNNSYSVAVPAGAHTIALDCLAGGDWVQIRDFTFGNYVPSLKSYCLTATAGTGLVAGWIVNRGYNFDAMRISGGTLPAAVTGATLNFTTLADGIWNVEWWNTASGVVASTGTASAVGGNLTLPIPSTNKDWAFKLLLSGTVPTATPTRTLTPNFTATPTPSSTASPSPSSTVTQTPVVCGPTWSFDAGLQGWARDAVYDAAFTGAASSGAQFYEGGGSVALASNFIAGSTTAEGGVFAVNGAGFPRDLSGRVLTAHLYVPAGMSNGSFPNGAFLYVKNTNAYTWNAGAWTNLPATAGWVTLTFNLAAVPNSDQVYELGLKVGLGSGAASWAGTLYFDAVDDGAPSCATNTPTPSPSASITPSPSPTWTDVPAGSSATVTPSESPSPSVTLTPSASSTTSPTPSATPSHTPALNTATFTRTATPTATYTVTAVAAGATPTPTPTASAIGGAYGQVTQAKAFPNPVMGNTLWVAGLCNGRTDGFELKVYSAAHALCAYTKVTGAYGPGWQRVSLVLPELANGTYYFELGAVNQGRPAGLGKIGKVVLMR